MVIPDELVKQFRAIALERIDRVENAWTTVRDTLDEQAAVLMHRELHTLKGESKMVGFSDINLVCHKLEALIEAARSRGYAVDEDFDLAVNMALRFMVMLVRKKVGAQLVGIDLPGFIRQIDGILAEARPEPGRARVTTGQLAALKSQSGMRMATALRSRLAPIAVDVFLEFSRARGVRRERLRLSWHVLRDLIGTHRAAVGGGQLAKHRNAAVSLARDLGKQVDVILELGAAEVTAEILSAIDTAVLHLVRNAVDHGIESPIDRSYLGKRERGTILVQAGTQGTQFVMTIEDDGRGVSLEEVRARAIDVGLIKPNETDIEDRWFDLVCQPGFTTRSEASDVSGRGVGLDAVRVGVMEVGGTLTASTTEGKGTTWRITIPLPKITFDAYSFRIPGAQFPIAIEASWTAITAESLDAPIIDLAFELGLVEQESRKMVRYFARDDKIVGIVTENPAVKTSARRLVHTTTGSAEVVVIDTTEGLLVYPERVLRR